VVTGSKQNKWGNLNNVCREESRHFRNKMREYLKAKINELAKNNNNTNIVDLHRRTNTFKRGYQPRSNLAKDTNGDLIADFHNIWISGRNAPSYSCTYDQ
jgi:hypothetical protein